MRLLLVEDKDSFRRLLHQAVHGDTWEVQATGDPQEALSWMESGPPPDVLLTDYRLPSMSGLELIRRARTRVPELRVILMSAFAEPKDIVEAMRLGAEDFLPKPFDLDQLMVVLDRLRIRLGAPPPDPREAWVAHSRTAHELELSLRKIAHCGLPVLFEGEAGSGKSRAARRLHTLKNASAPFLALDASSLGSEGLPDRVLSLCQKGSLFLRRLDLLNSASAQSLSAQMEDQREIRFLAGALDGHSVPDLLRHRFGALVFRVAPLRERKEDVLPLARMYLESFSRQRGYQPPLLDRQGEKQLLDYAWPGNCAELICVVERALLVSSGGFIREFPGLGHHVTSGLQLHWPEPGTLDHMLKHVNEEAEALLLRRAVESSKGDLGQLAQALGLSLRVLGQRLKFHNIQM